MNFQWRDWKSFIDANFYECARITQWHVVKIYPQEQHIQVAKQINTSVTDYRKMHIKGERK